MHRATVLLTVLALSACAYPGYVNDEYRLVPLVMFTYHDRSFRIFDKPSAGKLIITPSLGAVVSDTVVRGVTLGYYGDTTEREVLQAAAAAYLLSGGRQCTITGASLVYDPQWEFAYKCDLTVTARP